MLDRIGTDSLFPNEPFPGGQLSMWNLDTLEANVHFRGAVATIDINRDVDPAQYIVDGRLIHDGGTALVRQQVTGERPSSSEFRGSQGSTSVTMPPVPNGAPDQAGVTRRSSRLPSLNRRLVCPIGEDGQQFRDRLRLRASRPQQSESQ